MANPGVYQSPYPSSNIPNLSVSQFLAISNPDDIEPSKVILQGFENQDECLTYGGLRDAAGRHSAALRHTLSLQPGDIVSIYAYNSVNWAVFAHSVLWAGGSIRYARFCREVKLWTTLTLLTD
jgi:4-coumarate--CoA ligase